MTLLEILVIVFASLIVIGVLVVSIINKKKGKSSCGCNCSACKNRCACKKNDKDE